MIISATIDEAVDIVIGEDFNFALLARNFCGFKADVRHDTFKAISLKDDRIAHAKLILGDDGDASDEIFNHVLEGEADDGGQNPEASEERGNIHAEDGQDDEQDDDEEQVSQDARKHLGNGFDALLLGGASPLAAGMAESDF